MADFDEQRWAEVLRQPDWYVQMADELQALRQRSEEVGGEEGRLMRRTFRDFVAERLEVGEVALADHGDNLDEQRLPVDTVVIHHTSAEPGYSLSYMNAVHLLNVYVPYYLKPSVPGEEHLQGQPIWSNHFDQQGRQTFHAYHWFVRMDGSSERLLADDQIGWQAGNWEVNRRSVAICLDNDYEQRDPERVVLEVVAGLIKEHYPQVLAERVIGHCEANPKTVCPGGGFLGGWKEQLLEMLG